MCCFKENSHCIERLPFDALFQREQSLFGKAHADEKTGFLNVWTLQYVRLVLQYLSIMKRGLKVVNGR